MSDVKKTTKAVDQMAKFWPMIKALLAGTDAMRAAGKTFMPQWPAEEDKAYEIRLSVATLFPGYSRTVDVLSAKPFSKALTIGEDVPARIKEWSEDIDLQGRNLHVFSAGVCQEALGFGMSGILVDYPQADGVKTQAQEQQLGLRPYWVQVHPENILGWRAEVKAGQWQLTQLRLLETVTENDGEFGEKSVEQVRVLTPGAWQVWRYAEASAGRTAGWYMHSEGKTSLKKIPFVPVYGKRTGYMTGIPPLLDLAYLNVKHWQSQSDQDTILHAARVPILAIYGGGDDTKLSVGASAAVMLQRDAKMAFVEHSGKAIAAGRESLKDLEDQMRQAGAELLVIKPANITESQTLADNEQGSCALQRIAQDCEDAIDMALQLTAEWIGEASGGHVSVFKDFGALTLAEASGELLLKANTAGKISDETLRAEFKRRGTLSPDVDEDAERTRIEGQTPALGKVGEE